MSVFKKTVTSLVLLATFWHSAGNAMVATVKFSNQEKTAPVASNALAAMMAAGGGAQFVQGGLLDEPAIDIPLGNVAPGKIQDLELMQSMFTEISEMTSSSSVDIKPDGFSLTTPPMQELMSTGDSRIRSNDTGAIVSNVGSATQTAKVFDLTESAPMMWARYYPYSKVGYIQVITFRKKAYTPAANIAARLANPATRAGALADAVEIQTEVLGPTDGDRLARSNGTKLAYRGVNPFKAFIDSTAPTSKLYTNISFSAFMTTVGVWGRYYSTQRGFVAAAENRQEQFEWSECTLRVLGACLRRRNHIESYVETKPRWYIMASADNAIGKTNIMAYNSEECKLQPTTATNPLLQTAECVVFSGVGFLEASVHSDIPQDWLKVWHQHYADEGWTRLFYLILVAISAGAFSYFVGFIFAGTMDVAVGVIMAGLPVTGTIAVIEGVLIATAYGLSSVVLSGGGGLSSIQNGLFGSLSGGVEMPATGGDPAWSPNLCIVKGPAARIPYMYSSNHRHQAPEIAPNTTNIPMPVASGCIHWLQNDLETAPGSVGDYYRARRPNAVRDFSIPNDIKLMQDPTTRPLRNNGAPARD